MNIFSDFWLTYGSVVQFVFINMILAVSIYFTLYTGMLSLANAGFMAVGAYVSALLTLHTGMPFALSLLLGALAAAQRSLAPSATPPRRRHSSSS